MSLTDDNMADIAMTAAARWPSDPASGAESTWLEWRRSLDRFEFEDVMVALILLGETSERFPALARLIVAVQVSRDERIKAQPKPLLAPPVAVGVAKRLELFDQAAVETRERQHAELAVYARQHHVGDLDQRHALIDQVGPWEAHARVVLARGVDPAVASRAFVAQFLANATGDPGLGIEPADGGIVF